MRKILLISIFILTPLFLLTGCSQTTTNSDNPTINVKQDVKVGATEIKVGTFYDGKDGFSVSIPSGNKSVCTWTYTAGSGHIPNMTTTNANTATEKHTIYVYGGEEDLKVSCVDDFGNQYVGVFPLSNSKDAKSIENNTSSKPVDQGTDNTWNW